ncbi:hypothetical protein [Pseudomonas anguilliseptica]|uniref:Uncharacterized protein n=1 Tax=Pseudomonas anguilliseptica TaxID=53406 RepID=A0A1H4U527_PSEAG|nr:hypothetical protein [Pseudomonas anguilliseptica]SEC63710.1 hypothetical protein SAMN05421553_1185 [Pseudomonas anguilliseptica]
MRKRKLTLAISASITALCMLTAVQANPQEDFMLLEQEKAANQVYKAFFPKDGLKKTS